MLGVREKCAAVYAGKPLAGWAVEAARGAGAREVVIVCGEEVRHATAGSDCSYATPGRNPVESARNGLQAIVPEETIVFIPGDLPLIRPEHVADFVSRIPPLDGEWLATSVASQESVRREFGEVPGIGYMKVSGRRHAAAGLSAASSDGFLNALDVLSRLSENRKSQFKMAVRFGLPNIVRLFIGTMTVERAQAAARRLFGCECRLVQDCAAALVMDVDTPEDWRTLPVAHPATGAPSST